VILNPAIIALISVSLMVSTFAVYASIIGVRIIRSWNLQSGSEQQLILERKTYLISTIFAYISALQILSLFLFVYTADHIHDLFVGAMCAAGSLNVNDYGYVTLVVKTLTVVLCGVWLIVNHADNKGFDYPLIKAKYRFLIFVTCFLILETLLQTGYFMGLRADVITSCCGTLFSEDAQTIGGEMASVSPYATKILFFLSVVLTLRTGIHFFVTGRGVGAFSGLATWLLVLGIISVISFISVYYYELPTHHCPFCLLQKEYHYIGYPMYLSLILAGISGTSVGVIERLKGSASLEAVVPSLQKRLCLISMSGYVFFTLIALYPMIFSDFVLQS
jgi:hypothetical protein